MFINALKDKMVNLRNTSLPAGATSTTVSQHTPQTPNTVAMNYTPQNTHTHTLPITMLLIEHTCVQSYTHSQHAKRTLSTHTNCEAFAPHFVSQHHQAIVYWLYFCCFIFASPDFLFLVFDLWLLFAHCLTIACFFY